GGQNLWSGNHSDVLSEMKANQETYAFWRNKTGPRIHDPAKRELRAPEKPPYAFGTKRPALESSYFEVYNSKNVDLVNLSSDLIAEVTPGGVRMTSDDFYKLDIIVLATGYDFGIGSQLAIEIIGRNNVSLRQKWGLMDDADGPGGVQTYMGIVCAGFPNILLACDPHTPTAFAVAPRFAELQIDFLADCLAYANEHGYNIDTTQHEEQAWKVKLLEAAERTLIPRTNGWYMGNNIPGRRKEPLFWFGGLPEYMGLCAEAAGSGYKGFVPEDKSQNRFRRQSFSD
nr:hypothetical protein [Nostoc sp. EkiNYC01]